MNDTQEIYRLVVRNLHPQKYAELLPEAQEAMLREYQYLIERQDISDFQKRHLSTLLESLPLSDQSTTLQRLNEGHLNFIKSL